jgi:TRAP-type C4-dicarboxylate transport system permease small subunit
MKDLIKRFLSLILTATSIGVTLVLAVLGYEVALMIMGTGHTSGQISMVVLAALPSLFALLSLPFWLTLQRLRRPA